MKRIAMLLLVATVLATVASAANWIFVIVSADYKTFVYVDRDSVQRKGNVVSVWTKYLDIDKGYWLYHEQYQRDTHQFRIVSAVHYGTANQVLYSGDFGEYVPWKDIPPESVGDSVYQALFASSSGSGDKQGV